MSRFSRNWLETADEPVCFYCQKAEGRDKRDRLLLCADFDCNRSVHMHCLNPPLTKVHLLV